MQTHRRSRYVVRSRFGLIRRAPIVSVRSRIETFFLLLIDWLIHQHSPVGSWFLLVPTKIPTLFLLLEPISISGQASALARTIARDTNKQTKDNILYSLTASFTISNPIISTCLSRIASTAASQQARLVDEPAEQVASRGETDILSFTRLLTPPVIYLVASGRSDLAGHARRRRRRAR